MCGKWSGTAADNQVQRGALQGVSPSHPRPLRLRGGAAAATGVSSSTMTSVKGSRGRNSHKSERSLLSFAVSELSHHLHHVDANRVDIMYGLLEILYDRVNGRVSRMDMASIFIALGRDAGGGGGGV